MKHRCLTLVVSILLVALGASADDRAADLAGTPMEALSDLIGDWEVEATWSDGSRLWSRNEFRVGLGGQFVVARTFAKEAEGQRYERYLTYFAYDADSGTWKTYGFTYDGTVSVVDDVEVSTVDGRLLFASRWASGDDEVRQTLEVTSKDSYNWKVWVRPDSGAEWTQIMDGDWKRVHP